MSTVCCIGHTAAITTAVSKVIECLDGTAEIAEEVSMALFDFGYSLRGVEPWFDFDWNDYERLEVFMIGRSCSPKGAILAGRDFPLEPG